MLVSSISPSLKNVMSSPMSIDCSTRLALILKYTALRTACRRSLPTTTQPWPRSSTELCLPMPRARSLPRSMFVIKRSVSPKEVRLSHTGTCVPIPQAGCTHALSGLRVKSEGNNFVGVIVRDGDDVGTRLIDRAMDRPLEIHRTTARIDRVAVEIVFHDVV